MRRLKKKTLLDTLEAEVVELEVLLQQLRHQARSPDAMDSKVFGEPDEFAVKSPVRRHSECGAQAQALLTLCCLLADDVTELMALPMAAQRACGAASVLPADMAADLLRELGLQSAQLAALQRAVVPAGGELLRVMLLQRCVRGVMAPSSLRYAVVDRLNEAVRGTLTGEQLAAFVAWARANAPALADLVWDGSEGAKVPVLTFA